MGNEVVAYNFNRPWVGKDYKGNEDSRTFTKRVGTDVYTLQNYSAQIKRTAPTHFKIGDKVEAQWSKTRFRFYGKVEAQWYKATIKADNKDGTYTIEYDDDGSIICQPAARIRRKTRAMPGLPQDWEAALTEYKITQDEKPIAYLVKQYFPTKEIFNDDGPSNYEGGNTVGCSKWVDPNGRPLGLNAMQSGGEVRFVRSKGKPKERCPRRRKSTSDPFLDLHNYHCRRQC